MPHEELVQRIATAVEDRRRSESREHALKTLDVVLGSMCRELSPEEALTVRGLVQTELLCRVTSRGMNRAPKRRHNIPRSFLDELEDRHDNIHLDQAS